jgi:magnesium-transporting ATPase (P-type)
MDTGLLYRVLLETAKNALVTFFKSIMITGVIALVVGLINELAFKQAFLSNADFAYAASTIMWLVLSVFMVQTGYRSLAPLKSKAWVGGLVFVLAIPLIFILSAFVHRGVRADAVVAGFFADPLAVIWGSYLFVNIFGGFQLLIGGIARSLKK